MKHTTRVVLASLAVLVVASGCAKKKVQVRAEPSVSSQVKPAMTPSQTEELAALLRTVELRFDFDDATLNDDARAQLQKVAQMLRERPWATIRIAGHCDERGTEEYNIALGQRRADAARAYLLALGVKEEAVETVSFGAEMPKVEGHDEEAWAQNRRDELTPATSVAPGIGSIH